MRGLPAGQVVLPTVLLAGLHPTRLKARVIRGWGLIDERQDTPLKELASLFGDDAGFLGVQQGRLPEPPIGRSVRDAGTSRVGPAVAALRFGEL